jgi:hypothetical protein
LEWKQPLRGREVAGQWPLRTYIAVVFIAKLQVIFIFKIN